jgi:hypothetical protein
MIAVAGPGRAPNILDRRRVEMISAKETATPRFVYHAARELSLAEAERLVCQAAETSERQAKAALEAAVDELGKRRHRVVGSSIIVGDPRPAESLATVLKSHSWIHAAEGDLFRKAIRRASEALNLPVTEVRAKDLASRAAKVFRVSPAEVPKRLAAIGRTAGRPWAKDQKDSLIAALLVLSAT